MSDFMNHWFTGFEKGLSRLSEEERRDLLGECGKECSKSCTLGLYKEVRAKSEGATDFFEKLSAAAPEIEVKEIIHGLVYEIRYSSCLCDLHTCGYVNTGALCECSRQSLLFNLTSVFPDKSVSVELVDSILNGGTQCVLKVSVG